MGQLTSIASVPVIVTIVCVTMQLLKEAMPTEKFKRKIPLISALFGGILGILCFYCAPSIIAADNFMNAAIIGIGSGLAAIGANQINKQAKKTDELPKPKIAEKETEKESDPK